MNDDHRINGELQGCSNPSCGLLPDCAGNRAAMRALAKRKLDAIHDGTIHDCCRPRSRAEYVALVSAAAPGAHTTERCECSYCTETPQ